MSSSSSSSSSTSSSTECKTSEPLGDRLRRKLEWIETYFKDKTSLRQFISETTKKFLPAFLFGEERFLNIDLVIKESEGDFIGRLFQYHDDGLHLLWAQNPENDSMLIRCECDMFYKLYSVLDTVAESQLELVQNRQIDEDKIEGSGMEILNGEYNLKLVEFLANLVKTTDAKQKT